MKNLIRVGGLCSTHSVVFVTAFNNIYVHIYTFAAAVEEMRMTKFNQAVMISSY